MKGEEEPTEKKEKKKLISIYTGKSFMFKKELQISSVNYKNVHKK